MWIGGLAHGTTVLTRMLRGSQKILVVLLLLLLLFLTIQENTRAQESLTAIQFPSHTHWGRFIVFPNILKYLKSQIVKKSELAQSCPTLCDPMDCSSPGSSVYGILQARILQWLAIPFSRGSSKPRDQTWVSCIPGRVFTIWAKGRRRSQLLVFFLLINCCFFPLQLTHVREFCIWVIMMLCIRFSGITKIP